MEKLVLRFGVQQCHWEQNLSCFSCFSGLILLPPIYLGIEKLLFDFPSYALRPKWLHILFFLISLLFYLQFQNIAIITITIYINIMFWFFFKKESDYKYSYGASFIFYLQYHLDKFLSGIVILTHCTFNCYISFLF